MKTFILLAIAIVNFDIDEYGNCIIYYEHPYRRVMNEDLSFAQNILEIENEPP